MRLPRWLRRVDVCIMGFAWGGDVDAQARCIGVKSGGKVVNNA